MVFTNISRSGALPDVVYDATGTLLATLAMILITLHTKKR